MERRTGSKLGKEYVKAVYCLPTYLTYMQSKSCKMPDWIKHKLKSRLLGEKATTSDNADDTTLMAESEEELKSLLMRVKEENGKSWFKAQHSENEDHGTWSHHFMGNRWGNSGNSVRLYFLGAPKSVQMVTAAMKLKDAYSLEGKL